MCWPQPRKPESCTAAIQEAQSHPEVAKALDAVSIAPAGDRLKVEIPITEDQLNGLIKSHSFVLQMQWRRYTRTRNPRQSSVN